MKVKVTKERDCCLHGEDLLPIEWTPMINNRIPEFVFCKHCGRHHRYETYMDAAGSRDWHYVRMPTPWDK